MPLILPANTLSAAGYDVANSCRFEDGDSPSLSKTPGSAGDRTEWTFSAWIKLGSATGTQVLFNGYDSGDNETRIFISSRKLSYYNYVSSSADGEYISSRVLRDHSGWYHIVVAIDNDEGTAGDRIRFYINGVEETHFGTETAPSSGSTTFINNDDVHYIGQSGSDAQYFDGYMAEVCFIDGTQYAASDFGEFDSDSPSIWKPKDVSGLTFGSNGAYLDFEDSGNLGDDESGNGNDWAENNIVAADQATDTPTNNFCTGNPIIHGGKLPALSQGNCLFISDGDWMHVPSTIGVANGKWYAEFKCVAKTGGQMMGVVDAGSIAGWGASPPLYVGNDALGHCYQDNGNKQTGDTATSYGATYTDGDIIGAALNADDGEITFYKNNAVQDSGTAITLPTSTSSDGIWFWLPSVETGTIAANWGGCSAFAISSAANDENGYGVFEYAPPSDYLAMCTKNLATNG